jgi:hypothetical protein
MENHFDKSHDENKSQTKKMQQITTYKAAVHGCFISLEDKINFQ